MIDAGTVRRRTIAVDFDGVIHRYSKGWKKGRIYDPPMPGAVEAYYKLLSAGYRIIVFTCRDDLDAVRKWMHKHFDIEKHLGHFVEPEVTNKKPIADVYVDDRGLRFTSWSDVLKYFV